MPASINSGSPETPEVIRRCMIPSWYHEILTSQQCSYMQGLFDGKSIEQIAEESEVLPATVSRTIARARRRIYAYRKEMMPQIVGISPEGDLIYDKEVIL